MSEFLALVQANGIEGLVTGLAVLLLVFGLSKGGVVATKGQKQSANVILSILLSGVSLLSPQPDGAMQAAIASLASALVYEFLRGGLPRLAAIGKK